MTTARSRSGGKALATRSRILDAAAHEFRRTGYTGTRLSDIAATANTQAGSLYYHFSSREELVEAVLRVGQERTETYVFDRLAAIPPDAPRMLVLREAIAAHLTSVLKTGDYTAATIRILSQVPAEIRERQIAAQRRYGEFWRDLFAAALASGELRADLDLSATRMLLVGALNSSADWYPSRSRALPLDRLIAHFYSVFLEGIATPEGRGHRVHRRVTTPTPPAPPVAPSSAASARGAATTARILDAAATVFRTRGYAGTRLVDVATEADMQTGSLYYHFGSREDLVAALLAVAWQRTDDIVRRSVAELPTDAYPIDRLSTVIAAHLLAALALGDYTSALIQITDQVPDEVRSRSAPLQRAYATLWRNLLADGVAAGEIRADLDVRIVHRMIIGALNWTIEWYHRDGRLTPERLAEQTVSAVFEGITWR
ncbi:TetR family transcriptional regulator [Frankia sp. QA3]|uniref:TetR family transcriptional regulator n=1 Tax=Frankia sp. QA3 TaxID=710111 RepID=UPI000269B9D6|nr:TetR family transcriptional regulator [Frankia sp. QA3]EIV90855.1 transcriptional regulator [Frankia sp. QA3]